MDPITIESNLTNQRNVVIQERSSIQFCPIDHIVHGSEQKKIDNQNNILVCNRGTIYQDNEYAAEDKLVCYHERTSSCESAASSLSCTSYSSSNASGVLLNVSNLGPNQRPDETKSNFSSSDDSRVAVEDTSNNKLSSTISDLTSSLESLPCKESSQLCDVTLIEKDKVFGNNNSSNKKPDIGAISNYNTSDISDSKKPKKLIDFSVIKLRGRNILNKHDQMKMGQSANSASSNDIPNSKSTISPAKMNNTEESKSSNILELRTHTTCDSDKGRINETDNRIIGNRPEPEGHDLGKDETMSLPNPKVDVSKSAAFRKLEAELEKAQKELTLKEDEVLRLSRIRDEVESEMHELTASLFQEAHRMVGEANLSRASTEKSLVEATMKIDGLETEVAALKTMVLTSTPSQPNRHLHPQLAAMDNRNSNSQTKAHTLGSNNSLLQGNLKPGKNKSPIGSMSSLSSLNTSSIVVGAGGLNHCTTVNSTAQDVDFSGDMNLTESNFEISNDQICGTPYSNGAWVPAGCTPNSGSDLRNVDPSLRQEYLEWKKHPSLDRDSSEFLSRIYREDIDLCLDFPIAPENENLKKDLHKAIHNQSICITPLKPEKNEFKKNCPLLNSENVLCKFHVRLGVSDEADNKNELYISQLARNRITAVCNCLNYLDYIIKGLVKSHHNDVYWEIVQLRKNMVLARLGFSPD